MKILPKTSSSRPLPSSPSPAGLSAKVVGSGNVTTESRPVSGFHGLDLRNGGNVIVTQGDAEGLVIQGEDNILPLIETTVADDGTLRIGFKDHQDIHVTKPLISGWPSRTSTPSWSAARVTSPPRRSGRTTSPSRCSARVTPAWTTWKPGAVTVAIDGSGTVKLGGQAASETVNVNGSGDYEAAALKTGAATLSVAGSGDCEVAASETLVVNISGSGDVSYYGKPNVTKHISGSARSRRSGPRSDVCAGRRGRAWSRAGWRLPVGWNRFI